jgi:hypothetical protein
MYLNIAHNLINVWKNKVIKKIQQIGVMKME